MVKRIIITENQYKTIFKETLTEVVGNHNNRYEYELYFSGKNDICVTDIKTNPKLNLNNQTIIFKT